MSKTIQWFRDLWRGYSDADVASVRAKVAAETRPYAIIPISNREFKALLSDPRLIPNSGADH